MPIQKPRKTSEILDTAQLRKARQNLQAKLRPLAARAEEAAAHAERWEEQQQLAPGDPKRLPDAELDLLEQQIEDDETWVERTGFLDIADEIEEIEHVLKLADSEDDEDTAAEANQSRLQDATMQYMASLASDDPAVRAIARRQMLEATGQRGVMEQRPKRASDLRREREQTEQAKQEKFDRGGYNL